MKDSWADCCAACRAKAPDCNVWVYCDHPQVRRQMNE